MSKHTPGPWRYASANAGNLWFVQRGKSGGFVVEAEDAENALADARLIAAAPEMLEALKRAKQFIQNGVELGFIHMPDRDAQDPAHGTLPMVVAAISKAEASNV